MSATPNQQAPRHVFQIYIRTTPEALWDALTGGEHTRHYFHATWIESTWTPGARVVFRYGPDLDKIAAEGEVLLVERPRKLSHTFRPLYNDEMAAERPARVTWEIEPERDVCKLTLVHDDFDGVTKTFLSVGKGWPEILSSLKSYLETGAGLSITQ